MTLCGVSSDMRTPVEERVEAQREFFDTLYRQGSIEIQDWMRRDPRFHLMGPLDGRLVLDIGCGYGEWAVLLSQRGARVVATDVSENGLRQVRHGARRHGASVRCVVGDCHRLPFPDACFDLIHGQFILHHLELPHAGPELARVLKPGGVAVFLENSANNPVLMLARRLLPGRFGVPKLSTDEEYPLRHRDILRLTALFGEGRAHYFEFECFSMVDQKIFSGRRVIGWMDPLLFRLVPPIRAYGYTQWLQFRRRALPGSAGVAR